MRHRRCPPSQSQNPRSASRSQKKRPTLELAELEDAFFGGSEILEQIREAARSRLVSPWAVAGCVLMEVAASHSPSCVLPAMIGGKGSLNGAAGLVGPSGVGKSAAAAVANEVIGKRSIADWAQKIGPGTGEGLIESFLELDSDKNKIIAERPNAFMYVDEVSMLGKITQRSGTTTFPVLRSMLTGGAVSTTNADPKRRRQLNAHTYSIGVVAGIQPRLSEILLSDEESAAGTPQRWLWLPAEDPLMPDEEPEWPGTLPGGLGAHPSGEMWVEGEVRAFVRAQHRLRAKGSGDALDGHAVLTRLKVAAWLALLHSEGGVSKRWWDLSAVLMRVSDRTRGVCQKALAAMKAEEGAKKAVAAHHGTKASAALVHSDEVRIAKTIWRKVNRHSEAERARGGHVTEAVRDAGLRRTGQKAVRGFSYRIGTGAGVARAGTSTGGSGSGRSEPA